MNGWRTRAAGVVLGLSTVVGCSPDDGPSPPVARVEQKVVTSFASGSLVIPMDTTYQDSGMLKAFGLVYKLLSSNIPVSWVIRTGKAAGGIDFTASGTDLKTSAAVTAHGYRGGPFVIAAADRTAALPIITAWQTTNTTAVHDMAAFSGDVRRVLVAAPRIAVFQDNNELIAFNYLNAAGIPDSTGKAWPVATAASYPTFPDVLTPAQIKGATTGGAVDGVLLRADGTPAWCQLTSMHYNTPADTEVLREVRAWLNSGPSTHAMMECHAAQAFESDAAGRYLTTGGLVDDGATATPSTVLIPDSPFAQLDGTFTAVAGSVDSIGLAAGSSFHASDVVLINMTTAPTTTQRINWITGYLDGNSAKGKVSYLAGHQYPTTLPITTNPSTNGVRLFLNSLFESDCALSTGAPVVTLTKTAPTVVAGPNITFTLAYANTGTGVADSVVLTDAVPAGTTFVSATGGGTLSAGTVTWTLGNLKAGASGSVTFTVSTSANGTFTNKAQLTFKASLTTKTVTSNTTTTTRECLADTDCTASGKTHCKVAATACVQCLTNAHCSGATPICDATTNTCRACAADTDCSGATPACHTSGAFAGTCQECSTTKTTLCSGTKPVCLSATATCGCGASTDCPSTSPVCDATTKTCRACTADAECGGSTPACHTAGAFAGTCRECSSTKTTLCTGTKPVCLTATATCGCGASADCPTTTPTCDATSKACRACAADSDCGGATPACHTSGTFAGTCRECSAASATLCTGIKPVCLTATATCGCGTSTDCSTPTPSCNTATKTCVSGCVVDSDCKISPLLRCDTSGTPGACVECLTDSDCGGTTSGRVCGAGSKCAPGCRGTGGNGCPTSEVCSSTSSAIGTCGPAPDAGTDGGADGATDIGPADAPTDTVIDGPTDGPLDSDGDGLPDDLEKKIGTDPFDADSDDDGVPDGAEPDFDKDTDGDGLINALDPDSDNDGLFDGTELGLDCSGKGTDLTKKHCRPDADKGATKTDPLKKDTDGGGVSDGSEDFNLDGKIDPGETDPTAGHGADDTTVIDTDGDGLSDGLEATLGSDPKDKDSDDDGVLDGEEANPGVDTDGDGKVNVLDEDSDGDGLFDGTESGKGCSDPATDATKGKCKPDADPSTKTGVLTPDTDKGGVSDGDEDTNKNGKVDPGERDPLVPSDDLPPGDGGADGGDAATDGGDAGDGGTDASIDGGADAPADGSSDAASDDGALEGGGCGCRVQPTESGSPAGAMLALVGALALARRRRAA